MNKILLIFILIFSNLLLVFSLDLSASNYKQLNDVTGDTDGKNNFKRNYFDFDVLCGFSIGTPNRIKYMYGGNFGLTVGYQYAFTDYFAFGGGATGIFSLLYNPDPTPMTMDTAIRFDCSGGCLLLMFMIGDLKNKIALLIDIGGGWLFAVKVGIYIKGFVIALSYHSTYFFYYNNVSIDIGYKINW